MNTRHPDSRRGAPALAHLSEEQRVLVEQVSQSPCAMTSIRRRASALLLLDDSTPVADVSKHVSMDHRTVVSILLRYRRGGIYAALLGIKPSAQKRCWLALSPIHVA
ncbi:helix-turn-helix domain-containing protein [Prosthecobacter sp.]|uniref:helix-turn-helix domain-containing protein n=1 Tax=Prosthecobacter sp. TaxID=1965333 RepID=UPI003784FE9D